MESITLNELMRQTRELVSDPEDRLYGDLDASMADASKCLLEKIAVSEVEQRVGVKLYERRTSRNDPDANAVLPIPQLVCYNRIV